MNQRLPPRCLILIKHPGKEAVEQQILKRRIRVVRSLNLAQETAANDAAAAPHQRNAAHVQVPAIFLGRCLQEHVTLRIRNHLGAIERSAHILNELRTTADISLGRRSREYFRSCDALILQRRQTPREHRFANQGYRLPEVESAVSCPLTRAFLSGSVQYLIDNRFAVLVLLGKYLAGYLDQVTVQLTLVPLCKHFGQSIRI